MPLELGLFLGCKLFGGARQRKKVCIILDHEPFRYRQCISDISGQDIHAHGGSHAQAIAEIRNWLAATSKRKLLPGGAEIVGRYDRFLEPQRSPKTGQWWSPENRPIGIVVRTLKAAEGYPPHCEQCLERRRTETNPCAGPVGLVVAAHPEENRHPARDGGRLSEGGWHRGSPSRSLG
jgi:hypothetical protein